MEELDSLYNLIETLPLEIHGEDYAEELAILGSITWMNVLCSHLGFIIAILNHIVRINTKIIKTQKEWSSMTEEDRQGFPKADDFDLKWYWKDNRWLVLRNYLSTAVLMFSIPSVCVYFGWDVWNNLTAVLVGFGSYQLLKTIFDRGMNKLKA